MKRYVTLADVAAAAQVSVTTVSLSLRGHRRIPQDTRERIQKLAADLGYEPNPLLSSLAAYRQTIRGSSYQANIAVLSTGTERGMWRKYPFQERFWKGADERGRELGFKLEEFWLNEPGMSAHRLSDILKSRGINGLMILPQPRCRSHLNLPWDNFALLAHGYSLTRPQLHSVAVNHFHAAMMVMRRLHGMGYRRIGFLAMHESVERVNRTTLGGYMVERDRYEIENPVPPLILRRSQLTYESFSAWYMRHRPEAIFAHGFWTQILLDWLNKLKISAPAEIGIAFSAVEKGSELSGIDENSGTQGSKAVNLMKSMLDRGEQGIPEIPVRILVEGSWHPGKTLRRIV